MKRKILWLITAIVLALDLTAAAICYFGFIRPDRLEKAEHQRLVAAYRAEKMARYQQENESYADLEVDVAFLGDSLTDGYDVAKFYPQFVTVNRGIGGDTTFDLEGRLQVSVYDLQPKVAVMLIGANNFSTMFDNYEAILQGLQTHLPNSRIVLVSLTCMSQEWGKNNQLAAYNNVKIKLLAEKYGFTFVDMFTPLMDLSTGELYAHYTFDGGHLTEAGYETFTKVLTPVLEALVEEKKEA